MFISKKDLLIQTDISYGQLYRWKREGLIPEEWFIKQPSFTGQETFFPKDKILNRIQSIQNLKDKYSLEELAKMLSPEISQRGFGVEDLQIIDEINKGLIPAFQKAFDKSVFSYVDVIMMIVFSELKKDDDIPFHQIIGLVDGIKDYLQDIKSTGYIVVIFHTGDECYSSFFDERAQIIIDSRIKILKKVPINDVSNMLKSKYRKSFNSNFCETEKEEPQIKKIAEGTILA